MVKPTPLFDAPIPGQSLTAEVGTKKKKKPSRYSTVEEAFEYYATRITDPKINDSLLDSLEMGTRVGPIAEIIVQTAVMEGIHTIDVSILILPVVMELIAYVADEAGIEYNMGVDTKIDQDKIPESKIALAVKKMQDKKDGDKEEEPMGMPSEDTLLEDMPSEDMPLEESPQASGIMSRKI